MANCCLLIETLVSFQEGLATTNSGSKQAFDIFFKQNKDFEVKPTDNFYKNIRCGILHQGETCKGWLVVRTGEYKVSKKINADKFLKKLETSLISYREKLEIEDWDSEIWGNCRVKMCSIIKNCN